MRNLQARNAVDKELSKIRMKIKILDGEFTLGKDDSTVCEG
jgi:hypothetical protein